MDGDCKGSRCIAGYLRRKGYLADYTKSKKRLFNDATLPRIDTAMMNAAWLRHLAGGPVYSRNPYTDVDLMVASILHYPSKYIWYRVGQPFSFANSQLITSCSSNVVIITNVGRIAVVINSEKMKILLRDDSFIFPVASNVVLHPGDNLELNVQAKAVAVVLTEGCENSFVSIDVSFDEHTV